MASLALVVAHDRDRLIGVHGALPWRLPEDLRHFKALTLGHVVLMGRKTWESLPAAARPLPGRRNWVLSRRGDAAAFEGARAFSEWSAVQAAVRAEPEADEVMVIGGAELYALALPEARRIYLTEVLAALPCEEGCARFRGYDRADFETTVLAEHLADERHAHAFRFLRLDRRPR